MGPFDGYAPNREPMLHVMQMHRDAVEKIDDACPLYLKGFARLWDKCSKPARHWPTAWLHRARADRHDQLSDGLRHHRHRARHRLGRYKQLAGGGMLKIVNQTVPLALKTLGYDQPEIESILAYIEKEDTIEGAADLKDEHLSVFDCVPTAS